MRLGKFPFVVQKFLSSEDIFPTAAEDGTSRVRFWSDRDSARPDAFNRVTVPSCDYLCFSCDDPH